MTDLCRSLDTCLHVQLIKHLITAKSKWVKGDALVIMRWSSCLATMRLLASVITPHPCDEASVLLGRIKPAHWGPLQPQQNCPMKIQFIPQNTEGEE